MFDLNSLPLTESVKFAFFVKCESGDAASFSSKKLATVVTGEKSPL